MTSSSGEVSVTGSNPSAGGEAGFFDLDMLYYPYMGTNLKKVGFTLFLLVFTVMTTPAMGKEVATQDLGIENTGILPSNPFYFFKEWGRGVRRAFSFNPTSRAELSLEIVNERAAEMNKLEELNNTNLDGYMRAIVSYEDGLTDFKARLDAVKGVALSDKFLNTLVGRSLKYFVILDDLRGRFADRADAEAALDAYVDAAEQKLAGVLAFIPGNFESVSHFGGRFVALVGAQTGDWKDLVAVEALDRIEDAADPAIKDGLLKIKDSLLVKVSAELQAVYTGGKDMNQAEESKDAESALGDLPGDPLRRLKVLDEAREKITDPDAKNFVNAIRQHILDAAKTANLITKKDAETMVATAGMVIDEAQALVLQKKSVRLEVRSMLDRARFNLDAASASYDEESYGNSYGQATTALAAGNSALAELLLSDADYAAEVKSLKQYFDALQTRVKEAGISRDANPDLVALLGSAEKDVASLSDLINKKVNGVVVATAIRSAKLKLATIEQMLQRAAKAKTAATDGVPEGSASLKKADTLAAPQAAQVSVSGGQFVPAVVKVKKGASVTWQNNDDTNHWIASDERRADDSAKAFDSLRGIDPGEAYTFVFDRRGSFKYHDNLNPGMAGVVEVE